MLLRLAYLAVTNALAMLRLLTMSDHVKDVEVLALRHQVAVLERQLHDGKPRFTPVDRVFLAALLHRLPRGVLRRVRLLVRPDTVLRWHRDLIAHRHASRSRPKRNGRPLPTIRWVRALVLRLSRENDSWGYRRIHGELLVLDVTVAASTVWQILHDAGIDPAPQRTSNWSTFLRSQAEAIIAMDFFEAVTLTGARLYVLAAIEHATRRVRMLGATAHPTAAWVTQTARNLAMDGEDAGCKVGYLIRDRDDTYPALLDAILRGMKVGLSGVRMPRMNSIMERWIQSCRHELLDRTLVWNQAHLLRALREYEQFHHTHRPHRGLSNARPLHPLPEPITDPARTTHLRIHRRDRLGGILHEYEHAA
ncbi:integrase core domain-containing protein [Micromonospora sp. SL1-18]|uniref:integrase core domain-containing protein n=1 Tax=Micromonospora sp. SL1-18 TaxID=3399128 RepID=UPI003A4DAA6A